MRLEESNEGRFPMGEKAANDNVPNWEVNELYRPRARAARNLGPTEVVAFHALYALKKRLTKKRERGEEET